MAKITKVFARQILDSRGNPTVEVDAWCGKFLGRAGVPSGASTGTHEAVELRDGGKKFGGKGVLKAVENVNKIIGPKLVGMDASGQAEIDKFMIGLDGSPDKSKLGANASLGCSLACAKAEAAAEGISVYKYLNPKGKRLPVPFMNVINGGAHAGNSLDFQEHMIVPLGMKSFSEAVRACSEVYFGLGEILEKKYGKDATNIGDEGGYAPPLESTEEALGLLGEAIENSGYSGKMKLALDVAATGFFKGGEYIVANNKYDRAGLIDYYMWLAKEHPLVSIEDAFAEEDWEGFVEITKRMEVQIVGDDLFVTNKALLEKGIGMGACNCLLLKANQMGTLSEATDAARTAWKAGYGTMVSHRSGETCDPFISDLAVALECGQIKAGAPTRGERTEKYNQLLRIEEELGGKAEYAGRKFRERRKAWARGI